jgi:hypothetical protein
MAAKVFISYRRVDSAGHAGRVHDRLEREFGRDLLFIDVDAIPLGANVAKVLADEVGKCDVLLAIIGQPLGAVSVFLPSVSVHAPTASAPTR